MLWVYEGQTEFWGRILAARAGLRTTQETLDKLALDAAFVANRSGREWIGRLELECLHRYDELQHLPRNRFENRFSIG